jgi:hypothetical protein
MPYRECCQNVSMASRSYVLPLPATKQGLTIHYTRPCRCSTGSIFEESCFPSPHPAPPLSFLLLLLLLLLLHLLLTAIGFRGETASSWGR